MTMRTLSWQNPADERDRPDPAQSARATTGGGGSGVEPVCVGVVGGPLAEVRIFVPAVQAEEAARIFAELDFSGGDGSEVDVGEGENSEE